MSLKESGDEAAEYLWRLNNAICFKCGYANISGYDECYSCFTGEITIEKKAEKIARLDDDRRIRIAVIRHRLLARIRNKNKG